MRVAVYSTKGYDQTFLSRANEQSGHDLRFLEHRLTPETAVLAEDCQAICAFVNDDAGPATLERLHALGVGLIALRCAGFNQVDLPTAERLGITVARVPAYSPYAVAEHAVALMLGLNRKIPRAYARVREGNFGLEGLLGFDLHGSTVGIVGTGAIGRVLAGIMQGFGCRVLAFDPNPAEELAESGVEYVPLDRIWAEADIISLHCPLTRETYHLVDADTIARMKPGVMLINTSRGGLVDTVAVIEGLKSGQIGSLGLDVYEEEAGVFFEDLSGQVIHDDVLMRLTTFPNVLITGHQAFYTRQAMENIAGTTIANIDGVAAGTGPVHPVTTQG